MGLSRSLITLFGVGLEGLIRSRQVNHHKSSNQKGHLYHIAMLIRGYCFIFEKWDLSIEKEDLTRNHGV